MSMCQLSQTEFQHSLPKYPIHEAEQAEASPTQKAFYWLLAGGIGMTMIYCITDARFTALPPQPGTQRSLLDSEGFERVRSEGLTAVRTLATQWKKRLLDREAPVSANALTSTVKPVFHALSSLGAEAIDLRNLPVEQVNGVHLAVVLRATLSFKERTPGWEEALQVARAALQRDRIDENDALIGLI
jgi:hypothetical protein